MARLTGLSRRECTVERQRRLLDDAREAGAPFAGLEELETSLCGFDALSRGDEYCGASIDVLQSVVSLGEVWAEARRAAFSPDYLGELRGRSGVNQALLTRYSARGEVVRSDGTVIHRVR
jgi:hypothetical protein